MVDTGIENTHPDLADVELEFKDFIDGSTDPKDRRKSCTWYNDGRNTGFKWSL